MPPTDSALCWDPAGPSVVSDVPASGEPASGAGERLGPLLTVGAGAGAEAGANEGPRFVKVNVGGA